MELLHRPSSCRAAITASISVSRGWAAGDATIAGPGGSAAGIVGAGGAPRSGNGWWTPSDSGVGGVHCARC